MRIKTKNTLLLIFQAIALLLFFCPGVYTREFWLADGMYGSCTLRDETAVSFFTKITEASVGKFIGVLALVATLALLVIFIIQISSKMHIVQASIVSLFQAVAFLFYSTGYTEEPWDIGNSYYSYCVAFLFFLILGLMIAIAVISFVSDYKIKKYGIQDEQVKEATVYMPYSNADELGKYKELLDKGVITQEEFEAKKKQLLGL